MSGKPSQLALQGVIPPLVTPFRADGELDDSAARVEVAHMLDVGVHGLTVGGSTGEGNTLTVDESCLLARIAVEETRGRVPVISGIIADSTREVIERGLALKATGVDGLQITPPHYLFSAGEPGTLSFYEDIGDAVGLPIVVYNVVPWNSIPVATLLKLAEQDQIVAVKQSGADIHKLADLLLACNRSTSRLRVLTAVDALLYPSFMLGAHGAVAGILAAVPELGVELWNACRAGDHQSALALHERLLPIWRVLEHSDMPSRIKAALNILGRPGGIPRRPLLPVGDDVRTEIGEVLSGARLPESEPILVR